MGCNCNMFLFRYCTSCYGVSYNFFFSYFSINYIPSFIPLYSSYIQTIQNALKPGGYWINIGPLLYHWVTYIFIYLSFFYEFFLLSQLLFIFDRLHLIQVLQVDYLLMIDMHNLLR